MSRFALSGLLLFALLLPGSARAGDEESEVDWGALLREHDSLFTPLPGARMFLDPEEELKVNRRAPFTHAARDEIDKRRAALRLRREQLLAERGKRADFVKKAGAMPGPRVVGLLMKIYEEQLDEIDAARKILDVYDEAARTDINPGVDPGGVYWERWLSKERGAARAVVKGEEAIRDLALAECLRHRRPEVREWLARGVAGRDRVEVREQMADALAGTGDPEDAAALGGVLAEEREDWARVMILDAMLRHPAPASAPFVLAALSDSAWPVRSAAVAAVRALGRRDADAIDALLAAMEASEGRVRLECRDALCEATGQSFGLMTEEWRLWWSANREGWKAPAGPAKVPPPEIALPRLFGVPTASTRIAILVCRGAAMRKPVKRRAFGNDGEPSPAPAVDSALKIATWELSQALGALHDEQEFVVIVFGPDLHASSRKLARPTRDNVKRACGLVARFEPEGGSGVAPALRLALRMGVSAKVEDLALGGAGAVDTIFVVGGALPLRDPGFRRLRRLRRISFFTVALAALSAPPK